PRIVSDWGLPASPLAGDELVTTGARAPVSKVAEVVRVKPLFGGGSRLKMLLLAKVIVVVSVTNAVPPGAISGQGEPAPVPDPLACGAATAVIKFRLTGVMFVSVTGKSGTLSPFVSKLTVTAEDTVLPGRAIGTVISGFAASPVLGDAQIVVTSLAKKPVPSKLIVTGP